MATTIHRGATTGNQTNFAAQGTYPSASLRFDWANAILSASWIGGLYLDGWAHNHGKVDNTFFTPWHAFLYGTYLLLGGYLTLAMMANLRKGYALQRSLPAGYNVSYLGILIFAFGGVFDLIWHSLFGFEVNTEALLSPSHLLLATGGLLMITGPLRAWVNRRPTAQSSGWLTMGPLILTIAGVLAVLAFFTQFSHPFLSANAANIGREVQSISAILIQTALMMGPLVWLMARWRLPVGAITVVIFSSAALITTFGDSYIVLPGILVACLIGEALHWAIKLRPGMTGRLALLSFLIPVVYYIAYFGTIQLRWGLRWSIHLWAGTVIMAGVAGFLLALLVAWPVPATDQPSSTH